MKVICPAHSDQNASLHCYSEWSHCFVCGYRVKTEEILNGEQIKNLKPSEKTNIPEEIALIEALPTKSIRGLRFPADEWGYYIVWPDRSFFKKRLYGGNTRYTGPRGARAPLFEVSSVSTVDLAIVEGEINALSFQALFPECKASIASFGSANEIFRHLNKYLQYQNIYVIVDKDAPGVVNGMALKDELLRMRKNVRLIAMKRDLNDYLSSEEKEEAAATLGVLGVPGLGTKPKNMRTFRETNT